MERRGCSTRLICPVPCRKFRALGHYPCLASSYLVPPEPDRKFNALKANPALWLNMISHNPLASGHHLHPLHHTSIPDLAYLMALVPPSLGVPVCNGGLNLLDRPAGARAGELPQREMRLARAAVNIAIVSHSQADRQPSRGSLADTPRRRRIRCGYRQAARSERRDGAIVS